MNMNSHKKVARFMKQSNIHSMFVIQALKFYADSLLRNQDKLSKDGIINPQVLVNTAKETLLLVNKL